MIFLMDYLLWGTPIGDTTQHQIDPIPGDCLPNLQHHHMSPKESEILQGRVETLIWKGLIRESILYSLLIASASLSLLSWMIHLYSYSTTELPTGSESSSNPAEAAARGFSNDFLLNTTDWESFIARVQSHIVYCECKYQASACFAATSYSAISTNACSTQLEGQNLRLHALPPKQTPTATQSATAADIAIYASNEVGTHAVAAAIACPTSWIWYEVIFWEWTLCSSAYAVHLSSATTTRAFSVADLLEYHTLEEPVYPEIISRASYFLVEGTDAGQV